MIGQIPTDDELASVVVNKLFGMGLSHDEIAQASTLTGSFELLAATVCDDDDEAKTRRIIMGALTIGLMSLEQDERDARQQ
jgi:hypothetical protein